jgi:threonine/homoserine/homoserine lactone efflux protein
MSLTGKGIALVILWSLSLAWFSFLAWALSTERLQAKLKSLAVYIDGLCGLIFTVIGISILWQSVMSLS